MAAGASEEIAAELRQRCAGLGPAVFLGDVVAFPTNVRPGQGSTTVGISDEWGPGTRIPALLVSKAFNRSGVDHTVYDTTSILATIERSLGLAPLTSRDAAVNDLAPAVAAGGR